MFKNIGKSLLWLTLYLHATTIGTIIAALAVIFGDASVVASIEESPDIAFDLVMKAIMQSSVAGLIIGAAICIGVFLIYKIIRRHPFDAPKVNLTKASFCVVLGLALNCILTFVVTFASQVLPENWTTSYNNVMDLITIEQPALLMILGVGIFGPIMEEIIVRYGVHKSLSQINLTFAYIVSSLVFGLLHANIIQSTYATFLGFILAWVYTKWDNLWYPIILHITINTSSVLLTFIPDQASIVLLCVGIIGMIVTCLMYTKSDTIKSLRTKEVNYIIAVTPSTTEGQQ